MLTKTKQIGEMKKHINELAVKQIFIRFYKIIVIIFLLVPYEKSFAQLSRVAIVNLADSNLIYKHIGFTVFPNKSDTFDCQFNCKEYIDQELTRELSSKYSVSLISIPSSVLSPDGNIYFSSDIKNEVKSWITSSNNQYDYIIIIETGERADYMEPAKQKLRSSGFYSRGNPTNSWAAVFSTTKFSLIRTSNSENLDYGWSEMDYLLPLKGYQFSRENLLIDPEMLPVIKTELVKLFDYQLEYFLTNSYLISADEYDRLKLPEKE